jgi:hypothetical protein
MELHLLSRTGTTRICYITSHLVCDPWPSPRPRAEHHSWALPYSYSGILSLRMRTASCMTLVHISSSSNGLTVGPYASAREIRSMCPDFQGVTHESYEHESSGHCNETTTLYVSASAP